VKAPVQIGDIREALASRGLSPLHRYGQHFLIRPAELDLIVDLGEPGPGEAILEVGPGTGGLTERILARGARVVAVEIDRGLAELVRELFVGEDRLTLIRGDVMRRKSAISAEVLEALRGAGAFDPGASWRVIANLPYSVSSPFLSALVHLDPPPLRSVVTVQREVGEALMARPGSAAYGPLSFLAALYLRVRCARRLGPSCFHPRPQVDSVVMVLDRAPPRAMAPGALLPFARRLFQHRRKALRGTVQRVLRELAPEALAALEVDTLLERCGIAADARIEQVPPERIEQLWRVAAG
jgi:16S rRNA (adenine1518-N6/adenine1519-N6)-dimethyltransferase